MDTHCTVLNKTRGTTPRVLFTDIKNTVLGKNYELSVALLTPTAAKAVTLTTKHKDKASNVLAFPLSKTSGEILLCPATARSECRDFGMDATTFVAFLFIHGLLHLKGYDHSATMESEERRIMKQFGLSRRESR